jgi:hypothetical protein
MTPERTINRQWSGLNFHIFGERIKEAKRSKDSRSNCKSLSGGSSDGLDTRATKTAKTKRTKQQWRQRGRHQSGRRRQSGGSNKTASATKSRRRCSKEQGACRRSTAHTGIKQGAGRRGRDAASKSSRSSHDRQNQPAKASASKSVGKNDSPKQVEADGTEAAQQRNEWSRKGDDSGGERLQTVQSRGAAEQSKQTAAETTKNGGNQ